MLLQQAQLCGSACKQATNAWHASAAPIHEAPAARRASRFWVQGLGSSTQLRTCNRLIPTSSAVGVLQMQPSYEAQPMASHVEEPSASTQPRRGVPVSQVLPLPPGMVEAVLKLGGFLSSVLTRVRSSFAAVFPQINDVTAKDVHEQLVKLKSSIRLLALVAPLARVGGSESLTALYARTFERAAFGFAKMYLFCLFMRVLLSWFPGIDWNAQPWTFLRLITEPYLQIYRGILPPLFGQLDFTPLFGFLILQDVVEVMAPTYTMGLHDHDTSTRWTTSDVMCYFDGF